MYSSPASKISLQMCCSMKYGDTLEGTYAAFHSVLLPFSQQECSVRILTQLAAYNLEKKDEYMRIRESTCTHHLYMCDHNDLPHLFVCSQLKRSTAKQKGICILIIVERERFKITDVSKKQTTTNWIFLNRNKRKNNEKEISHKILECLPAVVNGIPQLENI